MLAAELRSVVCLLGRFPALARADLAVEPGEVVLVSGPNGAGKTTLLRVLAGLLPVYGGTVEVFGTSPRRARARIAYVGHDPGCYDDLTVEENARFFASLGGADEIDESLELLGLDALRRVRFGSCSAGQQRRLGLAIAHARGAELWLLDEPHAGLDPLVRDLVDEVIAAAPTREQTVIFSSHELERSRALASREVVVNGGRVFAPGEPVSTRPPTRVGVDA